MSNCDDCQSDFNFCECEMTSQEQFLDLTSWRDELHGEMRDILEELKEAYQGFDEVRIQVVGYDAEDKSYGEVLDEVTL